MKKTLAFLLFMVVAASSFADGLLDEVLRGNSPSGKTPNASRVDADAVGGGDEEVLRRVIGEELRKLQMGGGREAGAAEPGGTSLPQGREREAPARLGRGRQAGETKRVVLPGGAEMEMVWCPPGEFLMGSPPDEPGRFKNETQHKVTLTEGFWLAKYEVSQALWESVMKNIPSQFKGESLPVTCVSWNDCQEFCQKTGLRLPTEAEWEYACRAGTTGAYAGKLKDMGWCAASSTHPVGQKQPNAWGLYDMHGNVWEWCADWYGDYSRGAVTNPMGAGSGDFRVLRGGSFRYDASCCRSASRIRGSPGYRYDGRGFRPVARQE